jgi:hypothetical protein
MLIYQRVAHGHIGHIGNMQSLNLADLDFLIIQGNGGLGGTSLRWVWWCLVFSTERGAAFLQKSIESVCSKFSLLSPTPGFRVGLLTWQSTWSRACWWWCFHHFEVAAAPQTAQASGCSLLTRCRQKDDFKIFQTFQTIQSSELHGISIDFWIFRNGLCFGSQLPHLPSGYMPSYPWRWIPHRSPPGPGSMMFDAKLCIFIATKRISQTQWTKYPINRC